MAEKLKRCVILSAGPVVDADGLRDLLQPEDWIIAADGGLRLAQRLGVQPSVIVADFDSFTEPISPDAAETIIRLPVCKDETDTMAAARFGLEQGFTSFLLLGCTGGRMDHTLANLSVLLYLLQHGAEGWLADEHNRMRMYSPGAYVLPPQVGYKFSLLPFAGSVEGITLCNAAYPLQDATLTPEETLGVSNEFFEKDVSFSFRSGVLLVILSKD